MSAERQPTDAIERGPRYQPLVLLLAASAAGVVADRLSPLSALAWYAAACSLAALWAILLQRRQESVASWLLLAAFFAAGGAWHHDRWHLYHPDEIGLGTTEIFQPLCLEGVALSSPRWVPAPPATALRAIPKGDETELLLQLTAVRDGEVWRPASGRAHLDIEGHLLGVKAGDRLRVMAAASRPGPPQNPGEFDFASFERSRRVLCRLRGSFPDSAQIVQRGSVWQPRRWLSDARDAGTLLLRRTITPRRAPLASAILLGAREQLDPERNEGYLVTGTIHVLSYWTTPQVRHCASR